jgi:hypothetical protein
MEDKGKELLEIHREWAAKIDALKNMEAIVVPPVILTKDTAYEIYKQIIEQKNKYTGQTAIFVRNSFYKIISHNGFDLRFISILAVAFENAIHMYNEPVDKTHRIHTNFTDYSHYVAKLLIDGKIVYARFTLENLKIKPGKAQKSQFHSVHLSYDVNDNAADPRVNYAIIKTSTWGVSGTTDLKLQHWLNFVK